MAFIITYLVFCRYCFNKFVKLSERSLRCWFFELWMQCANAFFAGKQWMPLRRKSFRNCQEHTWVFGCCRNAKSRCSAVQVNPQVLIEFVTSNSVLHSSPHQLLCQTQPARVGWGFLILLMSRTYYRSGLIVIFRLTSLWVKHVVSVSDGVLPQRELWSAEAGRNRQIPIHSSQLKSSWIEKKVMCTSGLLQKIVCRSWYLLQMIAAVLSASHLLLIVATRHFIPKEQGMSLFQRQDLIVPRSVALAEDHIGESLESIVQAPQQLRWSGRKSSCRSKTILRIVEARLDPLLAGSCIDKKHYFVSRSWFRIIAADCICMLKINSKHFVPGFWASHTFKSHGLLPDLEYMSLCAEKSFFLH